MKKLIVLAIALIATISARAQHEAGDLTLKPHVGLALAKSTESGVKFKPGFIAGIELEKYVSDMFGISGAIAISQQGHKDGNTKVKIDYAIIPILANVYVAEGLAIKAGVQPAFKMRAKATADGSTIDLDKAFDLTDIKIKSFDFSIPVGLSYEFSNVVIDARYTFGLTNYTNVKEIGKNQAILITLGYKFNL